MEKVKASSLSDYDVILNAASNSPKDLLICTYKDGYLEVDKTYNYKMFNWDAGGHDEYSNWQAKYYDVRSKVKIKTDLSLVNGKKYLLLSINTVDSDTFNKSYIDYPQDYKNFYSAIGFPIFKNSEDIYNLNKETMNDANTVFIGEPIDRWWYRVNFDTGYASIYKVKADAGYRPPQAKDLIEVRSTGKVILLGGNVERSSDSLYYYADIGTFFLDDTYSNAYNQIILNDKQTNNLTFTLNSFTLTKDLSYIADTSDVFNRELYTKMYKVVLNRKYKVGRKYLSEFNSHLHFIRNGEHNFGNTHNRDSDIAYMYGTSGTYPSMATISNIPRVSSVYIIAEMPERAFNITISDITGKIDKNKLYIRFNEESTKTSLSNKVRLIPGSKYSIIYNNKVLFKGVIRVSNDDPSLSSPESVSPLINVSTSTRTIRINSINSEGVTDYFNEFNSRDKVIVNKVFQLN